MASHPRGDASAGWDGKWVTGWVGWRMGGGRVSTRIYPLVFCLEDQERLGLAGLPLLRQSNSVQWER